MVILHWSLTFDLSFIFYYQGGCQQPFSAGHNYFCVDYCVTRRGRRFSTLPSGDGVWVGDGSNWPRVSRGILNSICQLLPPRCRTVAPGRRPFLLLFRPKETGREAERARLLNVNVKDFDEFTVLAFFVKLKMLTAFDNDAVSGSDL